MPQNQQPCADRAFLGAEQLPVRLLVMTVC
jgi:hypothetical protein